MLAWGNKVSQTFRSKVIAISGRLGIPDPSMLMACMAWESGETFSPRVKNGAGSGAIGLIQFMPTTATGLKTSTAALAIMTAEDQLDYVEKYFQPYKNKLKTLSDLYMAILWPAAVGKPESAALWNKTEKPTTYRQNAGLDADKSGTITKAEAASMVAAKLAKGLKAPYVYGG